MGPLFIAGVEEVGKILPWNRSIDRVTDADTDKVCVLNKSTTFALRPRVEALPFGPQARCFMSFLEAAASLAPQT